MKIKPEHYTYMKQAISNVNVEAIKERIALGNAPKDYAMRLRFDCLYASGLTAWVCDTLYSYANDNHIDTALKSICKELNIN